MLMTTKKKFFYLDTGITFKTDADEATVAIGTDTDELGPML
jgi:hypothetical protein